MRLQRIASSPLLAAAALALCSGPIACSSDSRTLVGTETTDTGSAIGLALQIAPGSDVASVNYLIVGPAAFTKTGNIDVSDSTTIAATIGPVPTGTGFSITLSAASSDGNTTCSGSASFNVAAHQTTPVSVHLLCHEAPRTGSISLNGSLNICPSIDGISANPDEAFVGSSVALSSQAHDSDQGPAPLSYHWTAVGGTLSDPTLQNPVFTCGAPGMATATLTLSDGDSAPNCADTESVMISCTAVSAGGGAGASGGGAGGASGSGGTNGGGPAGAGGVSGVAGTGGAANVAGAANVGGASGAANVAGAANGGTSGANVGGASGASSVGGVPSGGATGASGASSVGGAPSGGAGGATDVVIYRVGDGSSALASSGNPVFADEYSASGDPVRSTALPTTALGANHRLIASGTATSEGLMTRSADGRYLVLTGYDAAIPTASLAGTSSTSTPRTIARLDASGNLDVTTALTDAANANNPRSAASSDGINFWLTGAAGGAHYASLGSSTSVQLSTTVTNLRQIAIFGGQLFVSDSSGSAVRLGTIGTGLPMIAGQTISNLPGIPASTGSPYGFFFADLDPNTPGLDAVYVADDSIGLTKYCLVGGLGGTWTAEGTIGTASDAYRGLTGIVSGTTVTLYATRKGGSTATGGGELVSLLDSSGFAGALTAAPTLLATAAPNTAFRGVALAPTP
ncbi:MAG TPA: hypothetical protein VK745_22995 [Polyangiaceae bacterium]|jgi:hypothetical protein|nr:hypothetical protein [Polyangiaceae bacterium]